MLDTFREGHYSGYHVIGRRIFGLVREGIEREAKWLQEHGFTDRALQRQIRTATESMRIPYGAVNNGAQLAPVEIKPNFDPADPFVESFASVVATEDLAAVVGEVRASCFYSLMYYLNGLGKRVQQHGCGGRLYALNADLMDPEVILLCGFNTDAWEFFDVGIREQHLLAMAYGIACTDCRARIYVHYGDSLLYRAADQLNVIAQGGGSVVIVAAQSGLTNARNGSTHQSSGQPGLIFTMPGVTFLEPADVLDLFNCLNRAFNNRKGPTYIRVHGGDATPLERAGSRTSLQTNYYIAVESSSRPMAVLVASGLTVRCAIDAHDLLLDHHSVDTRVISVVNPCGLDHGFTRLLDTEAPVLTVYNGNPNVLRSAVALAVCDQSGVRPLLIRGLGFDIGTSGQLGEILRHYGLDGPGIAQSVLRLLDESKDMEVGAWS